MAITKRSDGKYCVRVTLFIKGKLVEKRSRGINSKGEARNLESRFESELLQLRALGIHKIINWEEAKEDAYSRAVKKSSFATFSSMKSVLELHTSCWNDRPINDFITAEIENLIEQAYDSSSLESKKKLLNYIRSVFKRQIELGHLQTNPCSDLRYGKGPEKELIAMTRPEIEFILNKAFEQKNPWYPVWRVVYELGLRSGEGVALKWSDIDFSCDRVSINKSYCSKLKKIGPTKNKKNRTLPLNLNLVIFFVQSHVFGPGQSHLIGPPK